MATRKKSSKKRASKKTGKKRASKKRSKKTGGKKKRAKKASAKKAGGGKKKRARKAKAPCPPGKIRVGDVLVGPEDVKRLMGITKGQHRKATNSRAIGAAIAAGMGAVSRPGKKRRKKSSGGGKKRSKKPAAAAVVTADQILAGAKQKKAADRFWLCAGPKRTGCGGGVNGGHVVTAGGKFRRIQGAGRSFGNVGARL